MIAPTFNKIVWAVDTFEPLEFQKNVQFILGALTRDLDSEVYPIQVLIYPIPQSDPISSYAEAYLALCEKRMKQFREMMDIPKMKPGKISLSEDSSNRRAASIVLEYASEMGADTIVLSTHSRGAISRLFIGSFAETILLQANLSVVTVNPNTFVREKIRRVLFPTTFNKKFRLAFQKTLEVCASLGASLTVFYKVPFIPMVESSPELVQWMSWMSDEAECRKREAQQFQLWAKDKRVDLEVHIDEEPGNVAEEISSFAEHHNFDLIAMVSQTSQFEGPRVGSICRKVVRMSACPVWTFKTDDYVPGEID